MSSFIIHKQTMDITLDITLIKQAARLGEVLKQRQQTLALAESCTGGYVAQVITANSGSSTWFDCAVVSYSNRAKQQLLGVPAAILAQYGAVSEETAIAMAEGLLARCDATITASVTGIAGPTGGTATKAVGTVNFAIVVRGGGSHSFEQHFKGDRQAIRQQAVGFLLEQLFAETSTFL